MSRIEEIRRLVSQHKGVGWSSWDMDRLAETDIPYLLSRVERLEEALAGMCDGIERVGGPSTWLDRARSLLSDSEEPTDG